MTSSKFRVSKEHFYDAYDFEVDDKCEQLKLDFSISQELWAHVFILKNGEQIGQTLLTHEQVTRQVIVGKKAMMTSPTVLPQEQLSGHWRILFFITGIGNSEEEFGISYEIIANESKVSESEIDLLTEVPKVKRKGDWVKGDLHTHTLYSDGRMTRKKNLEVAKQQQLDFFAATDHNIVTAIWPKDTDVLVIPGCELTTEFGHCNYWGVTKEILNITDAEKMLKPATIAQLIEENEGEGILSINHSFLHPWEWQVDIPIRLITAYEIINDPTNPDNDGATKKALAYWTKLWNSGWKITGVGGSDSHMLPTEHYPDANQPSIMGDPSTFVHVKELTEENVLDGIKKGATIVSRVGKINFTSQDDDALVPGKQVAVGTRRFSLDLESKDSYVINWVFDGKIVKSSKKSQSSYELKQKIAGYHWLRADVLSDDGLLQATFTPVYWGEKIPSTSTFKELL